MSLFKLSCAEPKCFQLLLYEDVHIFLGSLPHVHVWKMLLHWSSCPLFSPPALLASALSHPVRSVHESVLPSPRRQRLSPLRCHRAQECVALGCGMLFLPKLPQLGIKPYQFKTFVSHSNSYSQVYHPNTYIKFYSHNSPVRDIFDHIIDLEMLTTQEKCLQKRL